MITAKQIDALFESYTDKNFKPGVSNVTLICELTKSKMFMSFVREASGIVAEKGILGLLTIAAMLFDAGYELGQMDTAAANEQAPEVVNAN